MYRRASVTVNEALPAGGDTINDLFSQHYQASFRVAYRVLRSREDAEDAVQNAYCAAFQHFHSFRGESTFKTWITRVVVNCCLMHLRERRRMDLWLRLDEVLSVYRSPAANPEAVCYQEELKAAHARAASKLPTPLYCVYAESVLSGVALPKVADQLGLTKAALKSRLFRARKRVGTALQPVIQRRRS